MITLTNASLPQVLPFVSLCAEKAAHYQRLLVPLKKEVGQGSPRNPEGCFVSCQGCWAESYYTPRWISPKHLRSVKPMGPSSYSR